MSLLAAMVGACGAFLAAEEPPGGPDGGDPDASDAALLDAVVSDGPEGADPEGGKLDAAIEAGVRKCSATKAFAAPVPFAANVATDVRAVRRRGDFLYFAYVTPGTGIDLGAAQLLTDGGTAPIDWFGAVNDVEGQTLPAPTNDTLVVVFQDTRSGFLQKTSRTGATAAFGSSVDYPITGGSIDGLPVEPYITSGNDLYFSTSNNKAYSATMGATSASLGRQLSELEEAAFPVVSDDGLEIFFVRLFGVQKVFHATRKVTTDLFGLPALDVPLSNDGQNTRPTWISPDGCTMYLVRTSGTANAAPLTFYVAKRN